MNKFFLWVPLDSDFDCNMGYYYVKFISYGGLLSVLLGYHVL